MVLMLVGSLRKQAYQAARADVRVIYPNYNYLYVNCLAGWVFDSKVHFQCCRHYTTALLGTFRSCSREQVCAGKDCRTNPSAVIHSNYA